MKNRKIITIFLILTIIFTLSGGTLAYLNWRSASNTAVTFTVESSFSCAADGGGNITSSQVMLAPSSCTNSTYAIKRTVKVMPTVKSGKMYMDLWLNINKLDTGLKNSDNFKYVLSTSSTSCTTGVVASGNFKGKTAGSTVTLLEEKEYTQTATETYYLYIWLDSAEESTETMNQTFNLSLGGECSNHISTGAEMLMEKANSESLLYADATDEQKKEMWTFSHEATEQVGATTDYRYIGSSPNNYITFNDEVWRIIGVFDGRIKIIRQDSLGEMSRDYKQSGVGSSTSSYGSNDWSDSQLMYMLNSNWLTTGSDILKSGYAFDGTYVKDSNGKIIYQKGCEPAKADGTTYSCSSNTWSLNDQALTQIDKVTYYLGGINSSSHSGSSYYTFERGTTVYGTNPTEWNGYVGLAYPSDYSYTFANGVDETCFNDGGFCSTSYGAVPTSSWMKVMYGSNEQWLISSLSGYDTDGFCLNRAGDVSGYGSLFGLVGVRPTVYLSSGIKLEGEGTSSNPYQIQ